MSKGPESKVKEAVRKLLLKYDSYYHMPVLTGFGKPSLDFVCCHNGRYFAVETKAAGKHLTERQEHTKSEIEFAHGKVFVVEGDHGMVELEEWLKQGRDWYEKALTEDCHDIIDDIHTRCK